MGAAEVKLLLRCLPFLHTCKSGPRSVNSEVIFKVRYVRRVPVATNLLMKKHKARELFNNKCLPTLSTLGCIITPLHGFRRNMCGIEELASYLAFVEHQTVDD